MKRAKSAGSKKSAAQQNKNAKDPEKKKITSIDQIKGLNPDKILNNDGRLLVEPDEKNDLAQQIKNLLTHIQKTFNITNQTKETLLFQDEHGNKVAFQQNIFLIETPYVQGLIHARLSAADGSSAALSGQTFQPALNAAPIFGFQT